MVHQAGGPPVEGDGEPGVVPALHANEGLIKAGPPRPVLLRVQPPVEEIFPGWRCWLLWRSLRLDRAPGPGVGLLGGLLALCADVGLGILVCLLHSPAVVDDDGGGCRGHGPTQRHFGKQAGSLPDLLAVVLLQTVVLQRLFALIVEVVVAKDGGQVPVLWPDSGGQRVEGKFRLLAILLQGLADGERGFFDHQPALVGRHWFHLSHQGDQIYVNTDIESHFSLWRKKHINIIPVFQLCHKNNNKTFAFVLIFARSQQSLSPGADICICLNLFMSSSINSLLY